MPRAASSPLSCKMLTRDHHTWLQSLENLDLTVIRPLTHAYFDVEFVVYEKMRKFDRRYCGLHVPVAPAGGHLTKAPGY